MNWKQFIAVPIFLLIIAIMFAKACNQYDERHPRDMHSPTIFVTDSTEAIKNCDECIKRNVKKRVSYEAAVKLCRVLWLNDTTGQAEPLKADEWVDHE